MSEPLIVDNRVWCHICKKHTRFLRVRSAARLVDAHHRTIYRHIEEGRIYAIRLAGKTYRVCTGCLIVSDHEE